jgi:hypothetical protein
MSRYAWLICKETKQMIWLGKIIRDVDSGEQFFHIGDNAVPPNSEKPALSKAVMKFLAQHIGKNLQVIPEEDLEAMTDETFVEIGDDPALGILFSDYVERFKG